jgi:ribulose-5-phosphate 4-epimerase/fuculose-1-phosphate aldolase
MTGPACDLEEGDRIAAAMGDKTVLVMANHGITVVGPTVSDAMSEMTTVEETCADQILAMSTGRKLRQQPENLRWNHRSRWNDRIDGHLFLNAWKRVLDKEEPDYAS